MKLLLELSMECESLARAEALAAAASLHGSPKVLFEAPGVLVMDSRCDPKELLDRLALCHYVSEFLGSCGLGDVAALSERFDVEGPIRVRSTSINRAATSDELARITRAVGAVVGRAKGVDLHSPRTDIRVVVSGAAYAGRVIGAVDRTSFEKRKNRYMPFHCPISLHPKYARALVNLTGVRAGERLLDPFCGTGAILTEASLLGAKAVGTDLSERMIEGARANLGHTGAEADLRVCDVGEVADVVGKVRAVATDPPYGRSTSTNGEAVPSLYSRAFGSFEKVLEKGAHVAAVVPDLSLVDGIGGFRLEQTHSLWVHRSLTRYFCLFRRS